MFLKLFIHQSSEAIAHQSKNYNCIRRQNAVKIVVEKVMECLKVEEENIMDSILSAENCLSLETQMALLSVSENFLGATEMNEILIQGISSDKVSWMSNIGLKAIVKACQSHLVTVQDNVLIDELDLYKTEALAEKLAQCLNLYEDIFEVVSVSVTCF